ncbi:aromatase/cyclase [Actinokineospora enzanensis]|uniref:aromatase/cyclase n=1 Tax=Actinokineospora enzanensis TaxID=155975 RepID=UPI000399BB04|nr:aromatase/cyclase [Actinokineospora enzanensis]
MTDNTHELTVAAPAEDLFDLVADVERAPQWFPTHLHAEVISASVVERYVLDGDGVRSWQVSRELDRAALRIVFQHVTPKPPLTRMRGEWTFTTEGAVTRVRVVHSLDVPADKAAILDKLLPDLDRNVPRQLAHLKQLGENLARLRRDTVEATATRAFEGPASTLFERALASTEDTALWRRVSLPERKIVVKRIADLDEGVESLTGEYRLTARPDGGVDLSIRRTATLAEGADESAADKLRARLADDTAAELDGFARG